MRKKELTVRITRTDIVRTIERKKRSERANDRMNTGDVDQKSTGNTTEVFGRYHDVGRKKQGDNYPQ